MGNENNRAMLMYGSYKDIMYTLARRYLGDNDSAFDAVQDLFVKIFEKSSKIPEEPETGPFLYRMMVNLCIDMLRRKKRLLPIDENIVTTADTNIDLENKDEVDFMLSRLAPNYRLAIIMAEILELPIREIAYITGDSEVAIRTRISRAKESLRLMADKRRDC